MVASRLPSVNVSGSDIYCDVYRFEQDGCGGKQAELCVSASVSSALRLQEASLIDFFKSLGPC